VVRSNKVVRRIPTESNGTPAMDLGHKNVVLKWCMCMFVVDLGIAILIIIIIDITILYFCFSSFLFPFIFQVARFYRPVNPSLKVN